MTIEGGDQINASSIHAQLVQLLDNAREVHEWRRRYDGAIRYLEHLSPELHAKLIARARSRTIANDQ